MSLTKNAKVRIFRGLFATGFVFLPSLSWSEPHPDPIGHAVAAGLASAHARDARYQALRPNWDDYLNRHWNDRLVAGIEPAGTGHSSYDLKTADPSQMMSTLFAAVVSETVGGASALPQTRYRGWQILLTPNVWASGLTGEATVGGLTTDLDIGFSDILDHIDAAAALRFEARKDRFSVIMDILYMELSGEAGGSTDINLLRKQGILTQLFGGGAILNVSAEAELEMTMLLVELVGTYRVGEWPIGSPESERTIALDVLAGARYWRMDMALDFQIDATVGPLSRSRSFEVEETIDWIDPIVGGRVFVDVTENITLAFRGDVGGFGVGSEMTWKATAIAQYHKSDRLSFYAGYQVIDVRYEQGSGAKKLELDIQMGGPVIGFAWRFGGPRGETTDGVATTVLKEYQLASRAPM